MAKAKFNTSIYTPGLVRDRIKELCADTGENQSELISRLVTEEYTHRQKLEGKFEQTHA